MSRNMYRRPLPKSVKKLVTQHTAQKAETPEHIKDVMAYEITKHAQERIQERFNISNTKDVASWMTGLMSKATYVKKSGVDREVWEHGGIQFVINPNNHLVITVYNHESSTIGLEEGLEDNIPEVVLETLTNSMGTLYRVKLKEVAGYCAPRYAEISKLLNQIHNIQDAALIEDKKKKTEKLTAEVNAKFDWFNDIAQGIQLLLPNQNIVDDEQAIKELMS
ncbi:hypothetical protein GPK34_00860 [Secundilactobacillus kimchicus]|uniref:hypothetical protein n=1 Tax=Secundilactobacillus kimchicus TaxID=528209 RepID=UPI001C01E6E9|nr:hypothetical protein [Secundilactobacillus kimchicus]MBT9670589.1 hypothetical protein [Secundilactobacillus kimchicus]